MTGRSESRLTRMAVERKVATLMLTLSIMVLGLVAWFRIPVELVPSGFSPPFLYVEVPTLRSAPRDIEQRVAEPFEAALRLVKGVERVETRIGSNSAGFLVALANQTNMDVAYNEVREQLDRARVGMGDEVLAYFVWKYNPSDDPVVWLGISTEREGDQLAGRVQTSIVPQLERVEGVSRVELIGAPDDAVEVDFDLARMAARGLTTTEAVESLRRAGFLLSAGAMETRSGRQPVRVLAELESLADLSSLPVGRSVKLGEVATVKMVDRAERMIHRVNGQEAIFVAVFKESAANAVEVSTATKRALAEVIAREPRLATLEQHVLFDQGSMIETSIGDLYGSALEGAALAVLILWLFLRRAVIAVVIALTIPASLLIAVTVMYFSGYSLNILSLTGLILAVGMVVDNAIVVSEQIERRISAGVPRREAVIGGASEVGLAITVSTATHVMAFVPITLMSGSQSVTFYLSQLGLPVCASIVASLFVSLIWIPWIAAHLPWAIPGMPIAEDKVRVEDRFARWLGVALRHRGDVALVATLLFASVFLLGDKVQQSDQAQANIGDVRMIYAFDDNVTVTEQERVLEEAERILLASREELGLRDVVVRMGGWMGRPQIRCFLVPPDDRKLTREGVIAALQERVPRVPGAKWSLTWDTSDGVGGIDLMIAGRQSAQLDALLPAVIERLERLPGVTSVVRRNDASSSRELQLRPDREIAATLGLPVGAVGAFVDLALRGREVGQLVGGDEPVKIYASAGAAAATSPAALNALPLPTLSGMVPLGSVTKGQVASGIGSIERVNGRTVAQLVVRTSREDIDALGKEMDRALATFPWPEGYGPEKGSRLTGIASNNSDLFVAFLLATVFIFLLMGFLFESFVLPLAILFSVPFAFTGAIWTLYLTGTPFDVMAGIGLVILVGVVVNNGIVLIDLVAELRRGGLTRTEALVAAGRERFRPVVMTALTTIVGLIPMAFGSTAIVGIPYAPLGRSLMGGMLFSTVLTLVVVPVAYTVIDDLRNWFYRLSGLDGDKQAEGGEVSDAAG
ncbi:MAG: efflux RND transporter permease subunit [Deltaproteobacteria bacterium]|nr:efflux RND transporter permease subunit [Deltaproteobacteria bacterium]